MSRCTSAPSKGLAGRRQIAGLSLALASLLCGTLAGLPPAGAAEPSRTASIGGESSESRTGLTSADLVAENHHGTHSGPLDS